MTVYWTRTYLADTRVFWKIMLCREAQVNCEGQRGRERESLKILFGTIPMCIFIFIVAVDGD